MALRGTRKDALPATRTRGCLARVASPPAGTGVGSANSTEIVPAAVVAAASPASIADAISAATSSQPSAMSKPAAAMRLAVGVEIISGPANSRSVFPGPSAPGNLAVTVAEPPVGMGPEGRNGPPAFGCPAPLNAAEARVPGGAEGGALRPPGHSAWTAECRFLQCGRCSPYGRKAGRTRRCAGAETNDEGDHGSRRRLTPTASEPATGGKGVPEPTGSSTAPGLRAGRGRDR